VQQIFQQKIAARLFSFLQRKARLLGQSIPRDTAVRDGWRVTQPVGDLRRPNPLRRGPRE
jgi:hypothetical protein